MKKRNLLTIMSLIFTLSCTQPALAWSQSMDQSGGEWYQEDGRWKYRLPDGNRCEGRSVYIDGYKYNFDNNGFMRIGWFQFPRSYYYADENGHILMNTMTPDGYWVDEDGVWNQSVPRWTNPNEESRQTQQETSEQTDTQTTNQSDGEAFANLVRPIDLLGGVYTKNSVGGVTAEIAFRNNSGKTIKYISFEVTPYNRVDDPVKCTIRDYSTTICRATGPFEPDEGVGQGIYSIYMGIVPIFDHTTDKPYYYSPQNFEKHYLDKDVYAKTFNHVPIFECVWYNSDIYSIKLTKAIVEYMDGSSDTINCDIGIFRDRFAK